MNDKTKLHKPLPYEAPRYLTATEIEKFVRIWQEAKSPKEVGDALNMKPARVKAMASGLRDNGVPLKRFYTGRNPYDYMSLARIANSYYKS